MSQSTNNPSEVSLPPIYSEKEATTSGESQPTPSDNGNHSTIAINVQDTDRVIDCGLCDCIERFLWPVVGVIWGIFLCCLFLLLTASCIYGLAVVFSRVMKLP